ncbi:MAG: 50S ribosomal protein L11 methyltransferase [Lachnospiraceae bacterium]|nr:50S ribosomal protein L11 methyltransferase [Lachnospiraceae bacterium]
MKYNKYTIQTTTEAEDLLISTLYDLGIEGVEVEDKIPLTEEEKAGMFVDILPDAPVDDGIAYLSFYLDAEEDNEKLLSAVSEELASIASYMDAGSLTMQVTQTRDEDFLNNWKQYFHQFYIDDILVVPSWEEVQAKDDDKMIIHIDPGTAFGTGMHETTQLCIRALRKYVTQDTRLLDVGTGSGILAIMAYKFGAAYAIGTDLDICAVDAVADNMEANGLADRKYRLLIGNIIDDPAIADAVGYGQYDIVTANILTEVLTPLTPQIKKHLKPGGIYITSGIIDDKEETMRNVLQQNGFEILDVAHQGEWVGITARKPE